MYYRYGEKVEIRLRVISPDLAPGDYFLILYLKERPILTILRNLIIRSALKTVETLDEDYGARRRLR